MRGVVAAVALALLALAGGAGAAASCAPAGATVLASSGSAQLYSAGPNVYGCLGSRDTLLGPGPALRHPTRIAREVLAGRYAGVDVAQMGVDTFESTVKIVNLATGATVASAPATRPLGRPESFIQVTAMAITAGGTLAWIGSASAIGMPAPIYEVRTLHGASERLLASGARIGPQSLVLTGATLRWRQNGRTRTASLAG
jgi:hypothetical protein